MNAPEKTPVHLWVVGGASALWNASGAFDYVMVQAASDAYLSRMSEAQRAYIENLPLLVECTWAIGVWAAVAGSLLLLARSRHAVVALGLSFSGILLTTLYQYGISALPSEMLSWPMIAFTAAIWIVAVALLLYAIRMRKEGALG